MSIDGGHLEATIGSDLANVVSHSTTISGTVYSLTLSVGIQYNLTGGKLYVNNNYSGIFLMRIKVLPFGNIPPPNESSYKKKDERWTQLPTT